MADPIPGVSESIRSKAHGYLTSGAVQVYEAEQEPTLRALVLVKGSAKDPYRVLISGRVVTCDCPARVWGCAHVVAALLVLEVPDPREQDAPGEEDPALSDEIDALLGG